MCKNLKIKFIITIIAIMFLALVIPSITNKSLARARGKESFIPGLWKGSSVSSGSTNWDTAASAGEVYISSSFFKKDYVFCIQRGQEIHFKDGFPKYTISNKYEIDGGNSGVLNGFAYILNCTEKFDREEKKENDNSQANANNWHSNYAWTWYQDDPVQLAVWAYIKKFGTGGGSLNKKLGLKKSKTGFPNISSCDIVIDDTNERIYAENENGRGHKPGTKDQWGDGSESSEKAYELYSEAVNLKNGTSTNTKKYSAEIRILTHKANYIGDDGKNHTEYQRIMLVESTDYEESSGIRLRIYKQDNFGVPLAGAKIDITNDSNIKTMEINSTKYNKLSLTSEDGDGCFVINNNDGYKSIKIMPKNKKNKKVKLKLEETEVPDGYTKLIDEITITIWFKEDEDNGELNIEEITVSPNDNVTYKIGDDGIGRIYIKNQSHVIEDGLEIIKTDTSGKNKLANAEFQIYFCWAKSITINGNTYTLDDISTNGTKIEGTENVFSSKNGVYYVYEKDNLKFIRPENGKGKLRPIMYIQNLETDDGGKIIIDKIITTDSSSNRVLVTVTETSAPEGYQCLGKDKHIYLELNINESGDGWQLIERTDEGKINDDEIKSYFTLDQNNLTLKLKNNSDSLTNVKLYKKDVEGDNVKDAEFTVTLTNVNYIVKNGATLKDEDSDGIITFDSTSNSYGLIANIRTIDPKSDDQITMKIEEKVPGKGTAKMPILEFTFNKDKDTGEWSLNPTDNTKNNYKEYYKQADDELTLTFIDKLAVDKLKLLKIDTTTKQALKGAKFKIIATNVSGINSTPYTTGNDGAISLEELTIIDPTENIKLEIEETEAAEDHYFMYPNPITVELKRENYNTYTIVNGSDYVDVEDNVITITLKDDSKKVSGLNIKKVDISGKYNVEDAEFQLYFNNIESIEFVGDDHKYTLDEVRKQSVTTVANDEYMSNGSVYKMTTKSGYTLISPIRDDGDADRLYIEGIKTNNKGEITSIKSVVASEENKTIYFNIKETKTSSGWAILPGTVKLLLHYDSDEHKWKIYKKTEENLNKFNQIPDGSYYKPEILDDYVDINEDNLNITLKDDYQIDKFSIVKTDSQTDEKIRGSKFTVTLSNIKSAYGYETNSSGNTTFKDIPGNTVFKDLVIKNPDNPVVITIEETKAPVGYKRMEGKIKITLIRDGKTFKISKVETIGTVLEKEFVKSNATYSNNSLKVGIKDIPIMNLGGIVWEANQINEKDNPYINPKINDSKLSGIKVQLYKNGNLVTEDMYGDKLMTKTAGENATLKYETIKKGQLGELELENGQYVFPNLERGEDYIIKFTYDGINYETIECSSEVYKNNNESKVTEVEREEFNKKFKTISDSDKVDEVDYSYSKANGIENYDMKYKYGESSGYKTSSLITIENGALIDKYAMTAISSKYLKKSNDWSSTWTNKGEINTNHYALDINCGLLKKHFDLSLGSEITEIKYTINGKELTDRIGEGVAYVDRNVSSSDYYYRYDKMKGTTDYLHEDEEINRSTILKGDTELEVYVTYKLTVQNNCKHDCDVVQVKYSYHEKQELVEIEGDNISYNNKGDDIIIIVNALKEGTTREIAITLKLEKNEDRDLPAEIATDAGLTCENTAEIISYTTTEGGLVDNNSAPGNYLDDRKKKGALREDDETHTAVTFKLAENIRVIQGNVAEADKDGNLDNEKNIDDVVVQLIEIFKNNSGNYVEYIWQETQTGSNFIKVRDPDGGLYKCTFAENFGKGEYKFLGYSVKTEDDYGKLVGFIPGNYIIRFIYGDGTTYDFSDDVAKYNGQEYKSAVDSNYKQEWYDQSKYGGKSTARDNEQRRLEVMEFSTIIDGQLGVALDTFNKELDEFSAEEKELLKKYYDTLDKNSAAVKYLYKRYKNIPLTDEVTIPNLSESEIYDLVKYYMSYKTWMCAETSKINVEIGSQQFENVNFGLVERPKTKLVFEKHITSLQITPGGVGTPAIVDSTLDIGTILEKEVSTEDATGIKQNLAIIKSTRENRDFWKVETDIEELAQGATVVVTYTYVIKNEGDEDYLSNELIDKYKQLGQKTDTGEDVYFDYIKNTAIKDIKNRGKGNTHKYGDYLGEYYYTGKKGSNDASVLSTVTKLDDYLNNNLKLVDNEYFKKNNNDGAVTKYVYDTERNKTRRGYRNSIKK